MKMFNALFICICFMMICTACGSKPENIGETVEHENETVAKPTEEGRTLVAFFSATGKTRGIAEYIAEVTGADLFEIVPEQAYSDADLKYSDDDCRANREQSDEAARPAIKWMITDFSQYDVVFIGHPIWWGKEPRIIDTFMESYDFSGKTIINFCTSGGSGIASATNNLRSMAEGSDFREGMRFETTATKDEVKKWIDSLKK